MQVLMQLCLTGSSYCDGVSGIGETTGAGRSDSEGNPDVIQDFLSLADFGLLDS